MVCYLFAAVLLQAEAQQRDSFAISRAQLKALQDFRQGRVETVYAWDRTATKVRAKGAELPSLNDLGGRVPLIGVVGHALWTTDRTLRAATHFPDLSYVSLSYCCRITDEGIAELTRLKSLKVLVLYRNHARFGGNLIYPTITHAQAKKMRQLITDKSLEHIASIDSLEVVYLGDNKFSENAMMQLRQLKNLKYLAIDSTQLSATNRDKLQRALPNCKIEIWNRATE